MGKRKRENVKKKRRKREEKGENIISEVGRIWSSG
jgi:hypothetical protein